MALILAVIICLLPLSSLAPHLLVPGHARANPTAPQDAQNAPKGAGLAGSEISATALLDSSFKPPNNNLILVEIEKKTLKYFIDGKLTKEYPVATGTPETPTPVGSGYIRSKGKMAFKYQSGPNKGKLKRYSRLSDGQLVKIPYSKMFGFGIAIPGYSPYQFYIHSTTEEDTIGKAASHGCVRMKIKDMLEFYPLVEAGTRIIIKP